MNIVHFPFRERKGEDATNKSCPWLNFLGCLEHIFHHIVTFQLTCAPEGAIANLRSAHCTSHLKSKKTKDPKIVTYVWKILIVFSIFSLGERERGTQCNAPDIYCSWRQSRANFWSVSWKYSLTWFYFNLAIFHLVRSENIGEHKNGLWWHKLQ